MATNVVYNVFNGDDCAFESMTKEQIYELIANSITQGELAGVDAENPFVTKIKEQNKGVALTFWVGTQAQFNAIETKEDNCFYIITDSTVQQDIENSLDELKKSNENLTDESDKSVQFARFMRDYFGDHTTIHGPVSSHTTPTFYNLDNKVYQKLYLNDETGTYVAEIRPTGTSIPEISYSTIPDRYEIEMNGSADGSSATITINNSTDYEALVLIKYESLG